MLNQVVDAETGAVLDVPSAGTFLQIHNTKVVKELKPEVDNSYVKWEMELPKLKDAEGDPWQWWKQMGDPAELLRSIAANVDNLGRQVATGRAFIKAAERPLVGPTPRLVPAEQRTPPPTAEELALRDPHAHERGPGRGRPQNPGPKRH